jgi:hypothetical protein
VASPPLPILVDDCDDVAFAEAKIAILLGSEIEYCFTLHATTSTVFFNFLRKEAQKNEKERERKEKKASKKNGQRFWCG